MQRLPLTLAFYFASFAFSLPPEIFTIIYFILIAVSILLVVLAVETISESKLRERKLRDYTEKVGKMVKESKE